MNTHKYSGVLSVSNVCNLSLKIGEEFESIICAVTYVYDCAGHVRYCYLVRTILKLLSCEV